MKIAFRTNLSLVALLALLTAATMVPAASASPVTTLAMFAQSSDGAIDSNVDSTGIVNRVNTCNDSNYFCGDTSKQLDTVVNKTQYAFVNYSKDESVEVEKAGDAADYSATGDADSNRGVNPASLVLLASVLGGLLLITRRMKFANSHVAELRPTRAFGQA